VSEELSAWHLSGGVSKRISGLAGRASSIALAGILIACGTPSTGSLSGSGPSQAESPSPSLPPDVQDAVRFRTEFGLRADLTYIADVARDPAATSQYGVPLLPDEVEDLLRRQTAADVAAPLLDAYGERHPSEFAGWFLDQAQGGVFVVLFTANTEDHLRGLWQTLLGRTRPIAVQVRQARYTLVEPKPSRHASSTTHLSRQLAGSASPVSRHACP
jgi:hypothetical protein